MEKLYKLLNNKSLVAMIYALLATLKPMATLGSGTLASLFETFNFLAYIGLFIIVLCEYKNIKLKSESFKYIPIVLLIIGTLIDRFSVGITIGYLTDTVKCGIFIFINLTYINKFANLIKNKHIYLKITFALSIVAIAYCLIYIFVWQDLSMKISHFCEMIVWIIILVFTYKKNIIFKKYTLMCFFMCTIAIIIGKFSLWNLIGGTFSLFLIVSESSFLFAVCYIIYIINYIFANKNMYKKEVIDKNEIA